MPITCLLTVAQFNCLWSLRACKINSIVVANYMKLRVRVRAFRVYVRAHCRKVGANMLIKFTYAELVQLAACLAIMDSVYGNDVIVELKQKIDGCIEYMDNAPVTAIYGNLF